MTVATFEVENVNLVKRIVRFAFALKNERLALGRKISFATAPALEGKLADIGEEPRFTG
jgi:hypothetical protein